MFVCFDIKAGVYICLPVFKDRYDVLNEATCAVTPLTPCLSPSPAVLLSLRKSDNSAFGRSGKY